MNLAKEVFGALNRIASQNLSTRAIKKEGNAAASAFARHMECQDLRQFHLAIWVMLLLFKLLNQQVNIFDML